MSASLLSRRLITVDEYHIMAESGILSEDDRVELIRGEIIAMSPIGSKHSSRVKRVTNFFAPLLAGKAIISVQDPIHLGEYSEPEPDVAILHPKEDFYESHHPRPEDIFLLIEIAESSLKKDREVKLPLYAASKIPEVWLVNVSEGLIEVYRQPQEDFYAFKRVIEPGGKLRFEAFGIDIEAKDILG